MMTLMGRCRAHEYRITQLEAEKSALLEFAQQLIPKTTTIHNFFFLPLLSDCSSVSLLIMTQCRFSTQIASSESRNRKAYEHIAMLFGIVCEDSYFAQTCVLTQLMILSQFPAKPLDEQKAKLNQQQQQQQVVDTISPQKVSE
jgi:hypothetical protein